MSLPSSFCCKYPPAGVAPISSTPLPGSSPAMGSAPLLSAQLSAWMPWACPHDQVLREQVPLSSLATGKGLCWRACTHRLELCWGRHSTSPLPSSRTVATGLGTASPSSDNTRRVGQSCAWFPARFSLSAPPGCVQPLSCSPQAAASLAGEGLTLPKQSKAGQS